MRLAEATGTPLPNPFGRIAGIALAIFVAILLTAVADSAGAAEPKRGGTLVVATETGYAGFDARYAGVINGSVAMTMIESLFIVDPATEKPLPLLGLSMEPSADRMTWTVKLRRGVTFSDGTPFNAAAVAFNYNRILDPANRARARAFISPIDRVEAADEYTAVFHLKLPWAAFPSSVTGPFIGGYMHSPTAIRAQGPDYSRHPVGTGAFLFKEWMPGDHLTVERNPDYWQAGRPYLDQVIFRPLPDTESRYASLLTKDVDVIWTDRPNHILKALDNPDVKVLRSEGRGALTTFLNNAKPPLDDLRVRKALQLAFDSDLFAKATRKGVNPTIYHPFGADFECEGFAYPPVDLERARQLIADYGKPVKVTIVHTTTARGREFALISQQMWRKIGVEVKVNPVDQTTLIRKVVTGDYVISGWRIIHELDEFLDIQMVGTFHSKSPANYAHYASEEMDRLVMAGRTAATREERAKHYCDVAKKIVEDVPILYRGGNVSHVIFQPYVMGLPEPRAGLVNTVGVWLDR